MSLPADVARCAGHTLKSGALLGICVACERQTAPPIDHPRVPHFTEAPAVRLPEAWACSHRIAVDDGLTARAA